MHLLDCRLFPGQFYCVRCCCLWTDHRGDNHGGNGRHAVSEELVLHNMIAFGGTRESVGLIGGCLALLQFLLLWLKAWNLNL